MPVELAKSQLPLFLSECLKKIPNLVNSALFRFGRSGDRMRSMRADRMDNHIKVLTCLMRSCSLKHDGLFCHIDQNWERPMMVSEIADYCGLSDKTVFRCMADLKDLGLIESQQIKRKNPVSGQLEVSIGIRRFTAKFWELLRVKLWFKNACEWAKKNAKRRLLMPFKVIKQKVKKTFTEVKDLANSFLQGLTADALRVRQNCEFIQQALRQKK